MFPKLNRYDYLMLTALWLLLSVLHGVNYLLFHVLAEFFSIQVAVWISVLAIVTFRYSDNRILAILGSVYIAVAALDLSHLFAYPGMALLPRSESPDLSIALWLMARGIEATGYLAASTLVRIKIKILPLNLGGLALAVASVWLGTTYHWEGIFFGSDGLTSLKIGLEYVIIGILSLSMLALVLNRHQLSTEIRTPLFWFIGITILSELCFTLYSSPTSTANMLGHFLKVFSFLLVFKALVSIGLQKPFALLSQERKNHQMRLEKDIEERVAEIVTERDFSNQIIETVQDTIYVFNPNTGLPIRWNRAQEEVTGFSHEEVAQMKAPDDWYDPEDLARAADAMTQLFKTGYAKTELLEKTKSGEKIPFEYAISVVKDEQGVVQQVISVGRDLRERLEAERLIRNQIKAFEQLGEGVIILDASGEITFQNSVFKETCQCVPKQIFKPRVGDGPEQNPEIDQCWARLNRGQSWTGEVSGQDAEGQFLYFETTASPVSGEGGKTDGYIFVFRDITRDKAIRSQLVQSQKMESIGILAGGVAHEINNPIGYVHSNLGTLENYVGHLMAVAKDYAALAKMTPEEQGQALSQIAAQVKIHELDFIDEDMNGLMVDIGEGVQRVASVVAHLREFTHISDSDWDLVDINETLEKSLKLINNLIKFKAELHLDLKPLPPLWGSSQEIGQVFLNLLINAAQAIEEKGDIWVSTEEVGNMIDIRIKDNGSGISHANQTRLFEPFFTTKDVKKGTGLGLSISYKIVTDHGGTIEVISEPGEGALFLIQFPPAKNAEDDR